MHVNDSWFLLLFRVESETPSTRAQSAKGVVGQELWPRMVMLLGRPYCGRLAGVAAHVRKGQGVASWRQFAAGSTERRPPNRWARKVGWWYASALWPSAV